jgi:hypothetical protein
VLAFEENEAWFADTESDYPFSIGTICDVLMLSYGRVLALKERMVARAVPLPSPRHHGDIVVRWIPRPTS